MVSAAALVLVLLQLHASDTLKENNEAGGPQPSPSRPQPPQPPGPRNSPPDRLHKLQGGLWRQDEDLLDLMVRIAQSPEEWERIHRVLSLIGSETDSYQPAQNVDQNQHDVDERENITENYSNLSHQNESQYKTTTVTDSESNTARSATTLTPLTTSTTETDQTTATADDMDTGWPDFEEAIYRKVKKPHVDDNDILATNWVDNDWLDNNWNNYLKNNQITSQKSASTVTDDADSKRENTIESNSVLRSRLFRDPKILEFHIKNVIPLQNHTVEQNATEEGNSSSHAARPMFVYHRVTTSPQQRRGNAFIAVSVVRLSPPDPPASTLQTPIKESSLQKHHRKHPHWRQLLHRQHNRSHRHHRVHH